MEFDSHNLKNGLVIAFFDTFCAVRIVPKRFTDRENNDFRVHSIWIVSRLFPVDFRRFTRVRKKYNVM